MWILESNGDFLQGKRMWLKPGQKYLFGRVKREGVRFAIDHKTVSRKHFVIEVDSVKEGDVGQIHVRTKIRIEDQNSKSGTSVNGELVKNSSRELRNAENSIRPGTFSHEIIIRWQPCVLTFNLLKREIKSGVLKTKQARIQGLDIKAISDFTSEHTTHVVANKRNTAKGLLALVTGKYLVSESYLDALEYAATPTNLSQEENLSLLETDFDSSWPDPKDHLPPPGKEPTIRPLETYQPNPSRTNIFDSWTFVFGDQNQYENLLPAITSGHGKAILFNVVNGETTSNELILFLRNASGHIGGNGLRNGSKGGVILVRWQGKDGVQEWTNSLINETALKLDQRAIDQSEFLDAILANDARLLKQSVPFESTNEGRIAPPPSAANSLVTGEAGQDSANGDGRSEQAETAQPQTNNTCSSRKLATAQTAHSQISSHNASQVSRNDENAAKPFQGPRFTQASKFRDFDDGFDPDAVAADDDDDAAEEEVSDSEPDAQLKNRSQLFQIKEEPTSTGKKRPRSPSPVDTFIEEMNDLLPAATALKRRKLAAAVSNGQIDDSGRRISRSAPAKKVKKEKELDVREAVRAQREEMEEAARRQKEELEAGMGDFEDKAPANLVKVVTMDLPVRDKTRDISRTDGEHGECWDPKWNGRKNFKGFRRKGEAPRRRTHTHKVIVPLVEVKGNTYGLGEQYWEKTEEEKEREREKKRREEARSQRTQSQTQRSSRTVNSTSRDRIACDIENEDEVHLDDVGDDDDDVVLSTRTSPGMTRLQREAAEIAEHEIDPDTPRRTRAVDRSYSNDSPSGTTQRITQTQTTSSKSTSTAKGKRPATTATANAREAKRQKILPVTAVRVSDSEDDSDDMKFRFGSRARRGRGGAKGGGKT